MKKDFKIHAILAIAAALTLYPFFFLIITSLKTNDQFAHNFWGFAAPLNWDNYAQAWQAVSHYVVNSAIVSVVSVVGILAVSALSAYAFARHKFPGSNLIFYGILALMMIPGVLTLISSFMLVKQFPFSGGNDWLGRGGTGLLNSHLALMLPYISAGQVFTIFVLKSFIGGLPEELFESARLDGASELRTFWSIAMPLTMPILGTMAIMNLLNVWNDYVWPLIVISDDAKKTLPIGLAFFQGQYSTTYGPLMAGYIIACIPLLVLFFLTMRYFVEGMTSGALKA